MNPDTMEIERRTKKARAHLTGSLYLLMAAYAFSVTMIGPMMPRIIDSYGLRLGQGGLIVTFQSIGGILAILIGGFMADIFKKSNLITVGYCLYIFGLFGIGFMPTYGLLLALFFIIGATRLVDTVLNAYISDLYPDNRSTYLNLLHTFFGVGAFIAPFYVNMIFQLQGSWNHAFLYLSFGCAALLFLFLFTLKKAPIDNGDRPHIHLRDFIELLTSRRMWWVCLSMFLYVGHQSGVSVWLPMYMETKLMTTTFYASLSLSVFWLGIIAGRFITSLLPIANAEKNMIRWTAFVGGSVLLGGFFASNPIWMIVTVGITGLATGAIIPLLVVLACDWHPKNAGTASSMIFLSGSLATMVFPWAIGLFADLIGFSLIMPITAVTLIAIFVVVTGLLGES